MIKAIGNYVLLKLDEKEEKSEGGIILVEKKQVQPQSGVIVSIGSRVKTEDLKVGQHVQFDLGEFRKAKDPETGEEFAFVKEDKISMILED